MIKNIKSINKKLTEMKKEVIVSNPNKSSK
jgi:hypothetical protein